MDANCEDTKNTYRSEILNKDIKLEEAELKESEKSILHPNTSEDMLLRSKWPKQANKKKLKSSEKKLLKSKSPRSESVLGAKKSSNSTGFSKMLLWDPWFKIGRKIKKEKHKKKSENNKPEVVDIFERLKLSEPVEQSNEEQKDNVENKIEETSTQLTVSDETKDKEITKKIRKVVRFKTDVIVVHYTWDKILGQTIEPLKKELEQQERNKALRKEFKPETTVGFKSRNKKSANDYMTAWYRK